MQLLNQHGEEISSQVDLEKADITMRVSDNGKALEVGARRYTVAELVSLNGADGSATLRITPKACRDTDMTFEKVAVLSRPGVEVLDGDVIIHDGELLEISFLSKFRMDGVENQWRLWAKLEYHDWQFERTFMYSQTKLTGDFMMVPEGGSPGRRKR